MGIPISTRHPNYRIYDPDCGRSTSIIMSRRPVADRTWEFYQNLGLAREGDK